MPTTFNTDYRHGCTSKLQTPERARRHREAAQFKAYKRLPRETKAQIRADMTPAQLQAFDDATATIKEVSHARHKVIAVTYCTGATIIPGILGGILSPFLGAYDAAKASRELGKSAVTTTAAAGAGAALGAAVPWYGHFVGVDLLLDKVVEKKVGKDRIHAERAALRLHAQILSEVYDGPGASMTADDDDDGQSVRSLDD